MWLWWYKETSGTDVALDLWILDVFQIDSHVWSRFNIVIMKLNWKLPYFTSFVWITLWFVQYNCNIIYIFGCWLWCFTVIQWGQPLSFSYLWHESYVGLGDWNPGNPGCVIFLWSLCGGTDYLIGCPTPCDLIFSSVGLIVYLANNNPLTSFLFYFHVCFLLNLFLSVLC